MTALAIIAGAFVGSHVGGAAAALGSAAVGESVGPRAHVALFGVVWLGCMVGGAYVGYRAVR